MRSTWTVVSKNIRSAHVSAQNSALQRHRGCSSLSRTTTTSRSRSRVGLRLGRFAAVLLMSGYLENGGFACCKRPVHQHIEGSSFNRGQAEDTLPNLYHRFHARVMTDRSQPELGSQTRRASQDGHSTHTIPSSTSPADERGLSRWLPTNAFLGIIRDLKARAPYYASDWTDAWNYRVVPAIVLIFFAK